ncbi:MAG: hypothetical protein QOJ03_1632 [Frankiaceae bacterium]|nr:hypothetical protein [Frankiaceae bacterium]
MSYGRIERLQSVRSARSLPRPTLARPTLGGILLGSADPDRLREWYCAALESAPDSDGFFHLDGVSVLIDERRDVAPRNPEPGRFTLHFGVDDIRGSMARLEHLRASRLVAVDDRGRVLSVSLVDPDGNHVRLLHLPTGGAGPTCDPAAGR